MSFHMAIQFRCRAEFSTTRGAEQPNLVDRLRRGLLMLWLTDHHVVGLHEELALVKQVRLVVQDRFGRLILLWLKNIFFLFFR
jgi:hypothetical protein